MKILYRQEIEKLVSIPAILKTVEEGFVFYSQGQTVIPPVASLMFEQPPGDCHIKYGYAKNGNYYVVKIASGFPQNSKLGLPSGNGLMLLFDKQTGRPVSLLLDEGILTELRTAAAGCIAAQVLAPKNVKCIGIVGTGAQAYYQLKLLSYATKCRKVLIWGRDASKAKKLIEHADFVGWEMEIAKNLDHLTAECNLIVTTTSSKAPLLFAHQIRSGTHLTAVGADEKGKQELDALIFAKSDRIVVDSRNQCSKCGDSYYALQQGLINRDQLVELGEAIADKSLSRNSEDEITVADLTGVAIQDLQIAVSVFEKSLTIP